MDYSFGNMFGDINNDGLIDIYIGNDFHENDYLYINNGNKTFTESSAKYFNHTSRFLLALKIKPMILIMMGMQILYLVE